MLLHSNPNLDQSRKRIVRTRRMENWRIYAPFGYLKLRNSMIGRLLRCCFIIRRRRRRSCPHGNFFHLHVIFLYLCFSSHDIFLASPPFFLFWFTFVATSKLQVTSRFPLLPFSFSHSTRHGSHSLNRHSASSTFYPTRCNSRRLRPSSFDIRHLHYLPYKILAWLVFTPFGWRRTFSLCYCIFDKSTHPFFQACFFFLYLSSVLLCICITNRSHSPYYCYHYTVFFYIYLFVTTFVIPTQGLFLCNLRISYLLDGVCISFIWISFPALL